MGRKPSYNEQGALRMPMGFPSEGLVSALECPAESDDIIVTSYPKCGTTWLQNIVYLIMHQGEPLAAGERLADVFPHLEEVGRDGVTRLPQPRLIKTHLPFSMTPYHPQARYLYVARNPFDCAVSFFHHTRGFPKHYDFYEGTFEEFFECFVRGEVDFGDYFDNLMSWYAHKDDRNVLFVTYESMKGDIRTTVQRVGAFLKVGAVDDEKIVEDVIRHSSFESMRQNQGRWASRRPEDMPGFIRKGIVGDWVNEFSADQVRRLLAKFSERSQGTDVGRLWPDILQVASEHR
jgi:hypothetical protein